ncbi:hypothetical protein [Nocardioides sp. L-11A]|uniref:hypothetical protein n=1 Tax=Nocardioides sp. L-11A TaxID=3043848 RepID=UPI00249BFC01|nr:hypothetical protein QJ852_09785 [Nocardioides sp. L-11A]
MTVRLDAMVAEYERKMKRAGDTTERAFDRIHASTARARQDFVATQRATDRLETSTARLSSTTNLVAPSQRRLATEVDRVSVAAVRGSASIDQYSGRLKLLGEVLAVLGPGLLPFGAGGLTAIASLAGLFGAGAAGALAMLGALQGVGDALKVVEKARLEPTADNLREARAALKDLTPQAREFVARFGEIRPVLKAIRDSGAGELFPGVTFSLDQLERLEPMLSRLAAASGRAGGTAIARSAQSLASDRWEPFLDFLVDEIPQAVANATQLVGSLAHAGAEMWMTFDSTNDRFVDWLVDVANGLDRWSSSAQGREDIRSFLAYAEKTGPKVGDFFVGAADALTQLMQAAAPLSGPVLDTLTALAKVVGAVADSDLGTPILAGLAALSLYNRALQVTATLQTKLTGSQALGTALAGGGMLGATRASGAGVRQLGRDLREYGALRTQVLARTTAETERMNAAMARSKPALAGLAKGGAALGGLAIATSGVADGMGATNAASLALLGTMAGPWGAAAGAVVGALMDIASANDAVVASYEATMSAVEANDLTGAQANLAQLRQEQSAFAEKAKMDTEDWLQAATGIGVLLNGAEIKNGFEGLFGSSDVEEGAAQLKEAEKAVEEMQIASDKLAESQARVKKENDLRQWAQDVAKSMRSLAEDIKKPETTLADLQKRLRDMGSADAEMGKNIKAALKNGADADALQRIIDELGPEAGLALKELAAGGREAAADLNASFYAATDGAGVLEGAIAQVGNRVRRLPNEHDIKITADGRAAMQRIEEIRALVAGIKGKTVRINIVANYMNRDAKLAAGEAGPGVGQQADGGLWSGGVRTFAGGGFGADGRYYPRVSQIVRGGANILWGEEETGWEAYISGKPSQRRRNLDIWAEAGRRLGLGGRGPVREYAAGGMVSSLNLPQQPIYTTATLETAADREIKLVGLSLKQLRHQLKLSEKSVEAERQQRDDLVSRRDSLVSGVRSGLDRGIWKPNTGSVWAEGSGDPNASLRNDIAGIDQFDALTGRLKKVLSGPALEAILAEGDLATIQAYAGMDDATLREYQRLYGVKQQRLIDVSGMVGNELYGTELKAANKELRGANRRLDRIEKAIDRSTASNSAEQSATRAESKKGAGKAAKDKPRGHVPKFALGR